MVSHESELSGIKGREAKIVNANERRLALTGARVRARGSSPGEDVRGVKANPG